MKTRIFLLFVLSMLLSIPCYAQDVPPIVTQGFVAYKASTYDAAFSVWMKGSPMESNKTTMMNLKGAFTQIESMYGKITGYEILRTVALSQASTRVYTEIRYERGPLYVFFDCYKSPRGWIIPTIRFQTDADKLLPDDFFKKK